jgi:hypothetical protein
LRGKEGSREADLTSGGKVKWSGRHPDRRREENAAKERRGDEDAAEARMSRLWRKVVEEGKSGKYWLERAAARFGCEGRWGMMRRRWSGLWRISPATRRRPRSGRRRGGAGISLLAEDGECWFEYLKAYYYLDRHRTAEITVRNYGVQLIKNSYILN